ncbi:MAG: formylglycine-generating enzyme family protein [Candidatus Magnetoovum sp. WYHC-5]|nr:formylglycine-generating enzyme family protein [Candidatus Magnetoovum sp. WYHC-5]
MISKDKLRENNIGVVDTNKILSFLNVNIELVYVRGGVFDMGDIFGNGSDDEQPVHKVELDDFYIGKYPVTQKQWFKVMGNNPSYFKGDDNCPVEMVSWIDAKEFIKRLNEMTDLNFELPSEAQWEYAARNRGDREMWAGTNDESKLDEYMWYYGNSGYKTHPVGQKKPNGLGIYDMSGNVYEWCEDIYSNYAYGYHSRCNPIYMGSGTEHVLRGGSWLFNPEYLRCADRGTGSHIGKSNYIGFRLVVKVE